MGGAPKKTCDDLVLIHGADARRRELHVLRRRRDRVEAGVVRAAEEGRPISGDLVRLKPWRDFPLVCDVETILSAEELTGAAEPSRPATTGHEGPPRVSTDAYRRGWDLAFGHREDDGAPN